MASSLATSSAPRRAPGPGDLLRTVAEGTAGVVGEAFFRSLVRQVATALGADVAFAAEFPEASPGRARVLAAWPAGVLPEGFEYELAGTPCQRIHVDEIIAFPQGTIARFPKDTFVADHRLDGYLGVAMHGAGGETIGYLRVQATTRPEGTPGELAAPRSLAA